MTYDKHTSPTIKHPADIVPILQAWLASEDQIDQDKEHFWSIGLSGSHQIIYVEIVSLGSVDQTVVDPKSVFRRSIDRACSAIIVAHSHPSGQLTPSPEDLDVTHRLKVAGDILGIEVLDHVILAGDGFYSMSEHDQV